MSWNHIIKAIHCNKEIAVFPSPAGMSLIKLFLGGNNLVFFRPERVWSVTSRLGTGKWLTLFYSVAMKGFGKLDRKVVTKGNKILLYYYTKIKE
jgi:hypothetical protein